MGFFNEYEEKSKKKLKELEKGVKINGLLALINMSKGIKKLKYMEDLVKLIDLYWCYISYELLTGDLECDFLSAKLFYNGDYRTEVILNASETKSYIKDLGRYGKR